MSTEKQRSLEDFESELDAKLKAIHAKQEAVAKLVSMRRWCRNASETIRIYPAFAFHVEVSDAKNCKGKRVLCCIDKRFIKDNPELTLAVRMAFADALSTLSEQYDIKSQELWNKEFAE